MFEQHQAHTKNDLHPCKWRSEAVSGKWDGRIWHGGYLLSTRPAGAASSQAHMRINTGIWDNTAHWEFVCISTDAS